MVNIFKWLSRPSLSSKASDVGRQVSRWQQMSDAELKHQGDVLRERAQAGEGAEKLLVQAFACAVIAAKRAIGLHPYDVQIQGGIALAQGKVAEMKTGEGKTLAATLPAFLYSLYGKGVHIVTVNDYLARRDATWMGPVFEMLGAKVGCIQEEMSNDPDEDAALRKKAYECDITYVTNSECVFDYLRDNLATTPEEIVQRGRHAAILDEIDLLLIDEAQMPLIISGPAPYDGSLIQRVDDEIRRLQPRRDFEVDHQLHAVALTESGHHRLTELLGVGELESPENIAWAHAVHQALQAHGIYEKDVAYMVQDDAVFIIDEHTGRVSPDKRFSNGLHQALEAKEGVPILDENITLSKTSYQHYFRSYPHLCGMTGTAWSVRRELETVYGLEVVKIPTFKPMIRKDYRTKLYRTAEEKRRAAVEAILNATENGRPVLVGTLSVEESDAVSKLLDAKSVPHQVLSAKHHEKEAQVVAQAGRLGAVTVSTNMAGRGTDIMLGGDAKGLALKKTQANTADVEDVLRDMERQCATERDRVIETGGLLVIGTGEHDSERIDDQLRGRAGRQGDPGASVFFISLTDPIYRRLGEKKISPLISQCAEHPLDQPIEDPVVHKMLDKIRRGIETNNAGHRKETFRYDSVLHTRRETVFSWRHTLLSSQSTTDWDDSVRETIEDLAVRLFEVRFEEAETEGGPMSDVSIWNDVYQDILMGTPIQETPPPSALVDHDDVSDAIEQLLKTRREHFKNKQSAAWERDVLLNIIDMLWPQYLSELEALEDDVQLHTYAEVDPVVAFRTEAAHMFGRLMIDIQTMALRAWLSGFEMENIELTQ